MPRFAAREDLFAMADEDAAATGVGRMPDGLMKPAGIPPGPRLGEGDAGLGAGARDAPEARLLVRRPGTGGAPCLPIVNALSLAARS